MRNYITRAGFDRIQKQIEELQKQLQGEIAKKVAEAASHGDLRENAEYKAIKEKQQLVAKRIQELSQLIEGALIIEDLNLPDDQVTVGKRVYLRNLENDRLDVYTILGPAESDPDNDIISYETPIARQLLMKKEGEEVEVVVPRGVLKYRIEKIEKYQPE
jgi:transcription elongation factor GreA